MVLRQVRRTGFWLAVVMMAVLTTLGVAIIAIGLGIAAGGEWVVPHEWLELDPVLWLAIGVAALAPWWALAAAVVQRLSRDRHRAVR